MRPLCWEFHLAKPGYVGLPIYRSLNVYTWILSSLQHIQDTSKLHHKYVYLDFSPAHVKPSSIGHGFHFTPVQFLCIDRLWVFSKVFKCVSTSIGMMHYDIRVLQTQVQYHGWSPNQDTDVWSSMLMQSTVMYYAIMVYSVISVRTSSMIRQYLGLQQNVVKKVFQHWFSSLSMNGNLIEKRQAIQSQSGGLYLDHSFSRSKFWWKSLRSLVTIIFW